MPDSSKSSASESNEPLFSMERGGASPCLVSGENSVCFSIDFGGLVLLEYNEVVVSHGDV